MVCVQHFFSPPFSSSDINLVQGLIPDYIFVGEAQQLEWISHIGISLPKFNNEV